MIENNDTQKLVSQRSKSLMGFDPLSLPLITYVFDWHNTGGTIIFGFLGLSVFGTVTAVCLKQIVEQPRDGR